MMPRWIADRRLHMLGMLGIRPDPGSDARDEKNTCFLTGSGRFIKIMQMSLNGIASLSAATPRGRRRRRLVVGGVGASWSAASAPRGRRRRRLVGSVATLCNWIGQPIREIQTKLHWYRTHSKTDASACISTLKTHLRRIYRRVWVLAPRRTQETDTDNGRMDMQVTGHGRSSQHKTKTLFSTHTTHFIT
jgi:hypothetical protein